MAATAEQKERMKEWYRNNTEVAKRRASDWKKNNPQRGLWRNCQIRARTLGLEFDIEPEDIVIPATCPYLGIDIAIMHPKRGHCVSVDRIDNAKGYVKDNIEVISTLANRMKNSASPQELVAFAREILRRYA